MGQAFEISIKNRYTGNTEKEKIYGHKAVEFAYNTILGKMLAPIIASKTVSKIYGIMMSKKSSAKKVPQFLNNFDIKTEDYKGGSQTDQPFATSFKSFNEFFIREFKEGKRSFVSDQNKMAACAEARYFGYEAITDDLKIPVKGNMLRAVDLLGKGKEPLAASFKGGPLMIARLCPVDYHRYHYPDDGKTIVSYHVPGDLHSVNPIALKFREDIFIKNERRVAILDTKNFGKLAYIEVGATCVGKIVQSHKEANEFKRGDQKGYFLFGGSTVIICGEPGKWKPSLDILENTKLGVETYIHLGDEVGRSLNF